MVAVLSGLAASYIAVDVVAWIGTLLVVIGIVVGLLNIAEKEFQQFLIAAIALIVAGTAAFHAIDVALTPLGTIIDAIVSYLAMLVAPAAVIVAVKSVWALASKK